MNKKWAPILTFFKLQLSYMCTFNKKNVKNYVLMKKKVCIIINRILSKIKELSQCNGTKATTIKKPSPKHLSYSHGFNTICIKILHLIFFYFCYHKTIYTKVKPHYSNCFIREIMKCGDENENMVQKEAPEQQLAVW